MKTMAIPKDCSHWRHRNGNDYWVVLIANRDSTRPDEFPITVVYRGSNQRIWAKPLDDFLTKMTPIPEE